MTESPNHPPPSLYTPAYSGESQTQSSLLASRNFCSMEKKASGWLVMGEPVSKDPGVDKAPVREAGLVGWGPTSPQDSPLT